MSDQAKMCHRCKVNEEREAHYCPFQVKVPKEDRFKCTCCLECMKECSKSV